MPAKTYAPSIERIAFDDFSSFTLLFHHYTQYHEKIAPFFAGDFRQDVSFKRQSDRTLSLPRNRELLADVLLEQNSRWGLDEPVKRNIQLLRQDDSVAVVTGQQLGLFLSPLYIPYKTLTTLLLAKKLRKLLQKPVVPIFWLHGEDHDFEEIAPFHLIDKNEELVSLRYSPSSSNSRAHQGPVGRIRFGPDLATLFSELESRLPESPNKRDLMTFLYDHFKEGDALLDSFAFLLKRLFRDTGLVLSSVDDVRLKRECAPLFRREISNPIALSEAVEQTSDALQANYHVQVQVSPTNLFLMDDSSRASVRAVDDLFLVRGKTGAYDRSELLSLLEESPELFSPNVIFRPLVQDFLFPTIAYVGGPGEIAYFAQCKSAYEWAGVPMPIIYPRASLTILEPSVWKVLDRYRIPVGAYREDPDKIFRQYVLDRFPVDLQAAVASSLEHVDRAIAVLERVAIDIDKTLGVSAASTKTRIQKDIQRFKEKIIKAEKRKHGEDKFRLHKASVHLFPKNKLQERVLSPLHFVNQYGLDFFKTLLDDVSVDTTSHQIIRL